MSNLPVSPPDGRPQLDHDALSELRAVLGDEFALLVSTWQADSHKRLEQLRAALAAADAAALREAAHSLKGSSLNVGALRLGDRCLALESAARDGALSAAPALLAAIEAEFRDVAPQLAGDLRR